MAITYKYASSRAFIYPSANAIDSGEINTEKHLAGITYNLTSKNFVVMKDPDANPLPFQVNAEVTSGSAKTVSVNSGSAIVEGYFVSLDFTNISEGINVSIINVDSSVDAESFAHDFIGTTPTYRSKLETVYTNSGGTWTRRTDLSPLVWAQNYADLPKLKVVLSVLKNATGNINPDQDNVCQGCEISVKTPSELEASPDSYAVLADIVITDGDRSGFGSCNIIEVVNPEDKYSPFDAYSIFIDGVSLADWFDDIVAPAGGVTPCTTSATCPTPTNNMNGRSLSIARADHNHDTRYIYNSDACQSPLHGTTQYISTNLDIHGEAVIDGGTTTQGLTVVGNATVSGNLSATGDITANRVFNAVWNDLAELYLKDDPEEVIEPGTLICKVKGKDTYTTSDWLNRKLVVGICSDNYGLLLGGEAELSEEENLKKYVPISLAGRVKVKVVKGRVIEEGDLISVSAVRGRATVYTSTESGTIIGKALESSDGDKDTILVQVMLK